MWGFFLQCQLTKGMRKRMSNYEWPKYYKAGQNFSDADPQVSLKNKFGIMKIILYLCGNKTKSICVKNVNP